MKINVFWSLLLLAALICVMFALNADRFCMAPFREAQTALSVRYIEESGGGPASYITPVFGMPWSIPMEYGLFQWLVAKIPTTLSWEDNMGKLVSIVFYLLCSIQVYYLGRQFGLAHEPAGWVCGLFLLSPVHLAFGAAYLIESFALFLALLHLSSGVAWLKSHAWWSLTVCLFSGIAAAVVKGPTWATAAFALSLYLLVYAFNVQSPTRRVIVLIVGPVAGVLITSLVAGLVWVAFSDQVKHENTSAFGLLSSQLNAWNYGTLEQKLSPAIWGALLLKEGILLFGPLLVLLPGVVWVSWRRLAGARLRVILLISAFLSAPIVFTNLHYRHQYYLYANGVYLLLALGFVFAAIPPGLCKRWLAYGLPLSCLVTTALFVTHHRVMRYPLPERLANVLSALPRDEPVAFVGIEWDPYIPYYASKRAWFIDKNFFNEIADDAIRLNRPLVYRAVVWRGVKDDEIARRLSKELLVTPDNPREVWPNIWIALTLGHTMPSAFESDSRDVALLALENVRALVPEQRLGFVQFCEFRPSLLFKSGRSVFRCVLHLGQDLYYFDSAERLLWRFNEY